MRKILAIALFMVVPVTVFAIVIGGSNLGMFGYSSHDCTKPTKPYKPYSFSDQWQIDSYNSEVDLYNSERERYVSCIKEYVENANNDIERIKEKAQEAINEVNY
jgi:hypothetical protein